MMNYIMINYDQYLIVSAIQTYLGRYRADYSSKPGVDDKKNKMSVFASKYVCVLLI